MLPERTGVMWHHLYVNKNIHKTGAHLRCHRERGRVQPSRIDNLLQGYTQRKKQTLFLENANAVATGLALHSLLTVQWWLKLSYIRRQHT